MQSHVSLSKRPGRWDTGGGSGRMTPGAETGGTGHRPRRRAALRLEGPRARAVLLTSGLGPSEQTPSFQT